MSAVRRVAVVDIGKTNAKLALVDLAEGREAAVRRTPNETLRAGPYPHYDVEHLWDFVLSSLAAFAATGIDAISVTTHGATAALLDGAGNLALPVLDYEHPGPDSLRERYERVRPPFAETGTPPLPGGLNLGAQVFWQARSFPEQFGRVRKILPYPQYWAFRLCGVLAAEATSLGCHTDLWNPEKGQWSALVEHQGWRALMPPVRLAAERLGTLLPAVAARTGLPAATPVLCGIHDSNASLLPHVMSRKTPFAVVSTGTWVIAMSVGGGQKELDPARDTLVNVDALGHPTPSARFMGGREWSLLTAGLPDAWSETDLDAVLETPVMLLPAVERSSGPFRGCEAEWRCPAELTDGASRAAAAFYVALMTATCLDLVAADGPVVVEGPFVDNAPFLAMLAAATERPVIAGGGTTGTSMGAAMLADGAAKQAPSGMPVAPPDARWARYARRWMEEAEARLPRHRMGNAKSA